MRSTSLMSRYTGRDPLTDDQIREAAPSVFASSAWGAMGPRYRQIPTIEVVGVLRGKGFQCMKAAQSTSRIEGKGDFTKHVLRFRPADLVGTADLVGREVPELVLMNSSDGSSAYKFMAGLFRLVCANGLTVQSEDFGSVSLRHSGDAFESRVIDATFEVMDEAPRIMSKVAGWKQVELDRPRREAFAAAAMELRDNASIQPVQLLAARRAEDQRADLWTTMNVVQENMIKGGLRGVTPKGKRSTTRAVKGVSEDVRLNRALWKLTEEMARLA